MAVPRAGSITPKANLDFLDALGGQLDLFFLPNDEQVVVVEMYSADAAGNDLVPTFQQILDSVTIPG